MAYENLKNAIRQVIKQNCNQEITGDIMQSTLLSIADNIHEIVQAIGESEDKVMSQKATSTELDKKADKVAMDAALDKKADKVAMDAALDKKVDRNYVAKTNAVQDTEISRKANKQDVELALNALRKEIGERNIIEGNVNNSPDEEDLTSKMRPNNKEVLSLKDREYSPLEFSGKGYKILRKNLQEVTCAITNIQVTKAPTTDGYVSIIINGVETHVDLVASMDNTTALAAEKIANKLSDTMYEYVVSVNGALVTCIRRFSGDVTTSSFSGVSTGSEATVSESSKTELRNLITPAMINQPNTIYEIRYDFDLNGAKITIPENCVLDFQGGSINNGYVDLTYCKIKTSNEEIFNNVSNIDRWLIDGYVKRGYQGVFYSEWVKKEDKLEATIQKCIDLIGTGRVVVKNDLSSIDFTKIKLKRNVTIESYCKGQNFIVSNGWASGSQDEIILMSPYHPAICLDNNKLLNSDVVNENQASESRASIVFRRDGVASYQIVDERFHNENSSAGKQWDGGLKIIRYISKSSAAIGYKEMVHFDKNGNIRYGQLSRVPFYSPEYPHTFEGNMCIENEEGKPNIIILRQKNIKTNEITNLARQELTEDGAYIETVNGKQYFANIEGYCRYGGSSINLTKPSVPHEFIGNLGIYSTSTSVITINAGGNYLQFRAYQDGRKSIESNDGVMLELNNGAMTLGFPIVVSSKSSTRKGSLFYNTTYKKIVTYDGEKQVDMNGDAVGILKSGIFNSKPEGVRVGFAYFCIDRQTSEGTTNGIMIYHKGNNVWVDALGRVIS